MLTVTLDLKVSKFFKSEQVEVLFLFRTGKPGVETGCFSVFANIQSHFFLIL